MMKTIKGLISIASVRDIYLHTKSSFRVCPCKHLIIFKDSGVISYSGA